MACNFLTGKPGGGKGILGMTLLERELLNSDRPILTNIPVRVWPWVRKGVAQLGLYWYLRGKHGEKIAKAAEWRVQVLSDEQIAEFYAWRLVGRGKGARLVRVHTERHRVKGDSGGEERGSIREFSTRAHALGGHLYLIDEAWKFWSSRAWKETGAGILFYSAQHRHFGDDVFFITQSPGQMETALHRVALEYWTSTNRSMLRLGPFRQPDDFKVAVYESLQAKKPMHSWTFKLDRKGLCQTYDTSAGVGLAGGMSADLGRIRRGVPWRLVYLAGLLVPILLWFGIRKALAFGKASLDKVVNVTPASGSSSNSWQGKVVDKLTGGVSGKVGGFSGGVTNPPVGAVPIVPASVPVARPVEMTGRVLVNGVTFILLSDGETVPVCGDGRVTMWCPRYAVVDGVTNWVRRIQGGGDLYSSSSTVGPYVPPGVSAATHRKLHPPRFVDGSP